MYNPQSLVTIWFSVGFPSVDEVMSGLYREYCEMIEEKLQGKSRLLIKKIQQDDEAVFSYIVKCAGIKD